eukprot:TRINITY_DN67239_c2_g3_i1.p1 TRINITY_DN67239_c2_g3~~TRINITY_DN67239_c2_g3_i1.p1  ORF type:complete len:609 (-),score=-6.25 TRINITY_DN67239_c2_g3_i1:632-2365(-)
MVVVLVLMHTVLSQENSTAEHQELLSPAFLYGGGVVIVVQLAVKMVMKAAKKCESGEGVRSATNSLHCSQGSWNSRTVCCNAFTPSGPVPWNPAGPMPTSSPLDLRQLESLQQQFSWQLMTFRSGTGAHLIPTVLRPVGNSSVTHPVEELIHWQKYEVVTKKDDCWAETMLGKLRGVGFYPSTARNLEEIHDYVNQTFEKWTPSANTVITSAVEYLENKAGYTVHDGLPVHLWTNNGRGPELNPCHAIHSTISHLLSPAHRNNMPENFAWYLKYMLTSLVECTSWINKSTTPLWRGQPQPWSTMAGKYKLGHKITEWRFLACSRSEEIAKTFLPDGKGVLFKFTNASGFEVGNLSAHRFESEVLVLPISEFWVRATTQRDDGVMVVELEMTDGGGQLAQYVHNEMIPQLDSIKSQFTDTESAKGNKGNRKRKPKLTDVQHAILRAIKRPLLDYWKTELTYDQKKDSLLTQLQQVKETIVLIGLYDDYSTQVTHPCGWNGCAQPLSWIGVQLTLCDEIRSAIDQTAVDDGTMDKDVRHFTSRINELLFYLLQGNRHTCEMCMCYSWRETPRESWRVVH